jgi:hypothetical protein
VDETLQETWTVALTLKDVVAVAARIGLGARHNIIKPITKMEDADLIVPALLRLWKSSLWISYRHIYAKVQWLEEFY